MTDKASVEIHPLGPAIASFAALLVLLTVTKSREVELAVLWFAISFPTSFTAFVFQDLLASIAASKRFRQVEAVRILLAACGQLGFFIGLYWTIRYLSATAASYFVWISISVYVVTFAALFYLAPARAEARKKRNAENVSRGAA